MPAPRSRRCHWHGLALGAGILLSAQPAIGFGDVTDSTKQIGSPSSTSPAPDVWKTRCEADIDANFEDFYAVSGANTFALVGDISIPEDLKLLTRFIEKCWSIGGLFWEAVLDLKSYYADLKKDLDACTTCWGWEPLIEQWSQAPDITRSAICAPATCDRAGLRSAVLPRMVPRFYKFLAPLPVVKAQQVQLQELSHWSRYELDFVVGGVNTCGTSSLRRNLAKHPEVTLTMDREDDRLFRHDSLLPYKWEVEGLNFEWIRRQSRYKTLRGLAHPGLFGNARLRHGLSMIKDLRMVAIVCDPISRWEKMAFVHHLCGPGKNLLPVGEDRELRCWETLSSAATSPELLRKWHASDALRSTLEVFGARLLLLQQTSLRADPDRFYGDLARVLGLSPFPDYVQFGRYNALLGHRTDLCHNSTLLSWLKVKFEPEYIELSRIIRDATGAVPSGLERRETRCDRPEDLNGATLSLNEADLERRALERKLRECSQQQSELQVLRARVAALSYEQLERADERSNGREPDRHPTN